MVSYKILKIQDFAANLAGKICRQDLEFSTSCGKILNFPKSFRQDLEFSKPCRQDLDRITKGTG